MLRWNTGTDVQGSFEDTEDVFLNKASAGSLDAVSSPTKSTLTVSVSSGLTIVINNDPFQGERVS